MIKGIEHIGICAKDTETLKNWYVNLLGFKVVYENNKNPKTYFLHVQDGSMIEIYPAQEGTGSCNNKVQGIRHIALIPDDFDKACETLKKNGVEILEDAKVSSSGVKTIFFKDPEDNILHFIDRANPLF